MERGGEVARNLARFYGLVRAGLIEAQLKQSSSLLEQQISQLVTVHEAWLEVERATARNRRFANPQPSRISRRFPLRKSPPPTGTRDAVRRYPAQHLRETNHRLLPWLDGLVALQGRPAAATPATYVRTAFRTAERRRGIARRTYPTKREPIPSSTDELEHVSPQCGTVARRFCHPSIASC